jgi:hypothetical protein
VVRLFVDRYRTTGADNFGFLPETGFDVDQLVNPAFRRACFGGTLPAHRDGCIVSAVSEEGCAAGKVHVDDILMAIDGVPVSEECDVEFRGQERLDMEYLITRKAPGETVKLTLLRKQDETNAGGVEKITVQLELTAPKSRGQRLGIGMTWDWAVVGGLVFTGYRDEDWAAPFALPPSSLPDDCDATQMVYLMSVLHHPINVSYEAYAADQELVRDVNGIRITSLQHFIEVVTTEIAAAPLLTFDFREKGLAAYRKALVRDETSAAGTGSRSYLVFDTAELKASEEEILSANRVPSWCTPGLLPSISPETESQPQPQLEPMAAEISKEEMAAKFVEWESTASVCDWCGELKDLFSPDDTNPDSRRFIDLIGQEVCISGDTCGEKWGRKFDPESAVSPTLSYGDREALGAAFKTCVMHTNFASKVPRDAPQAVQDEVFAGALAFTVVLGSVDGKKVLKWNGLYDGKGGHFTPAGCDVTASECDSFWVYTKEANLRCEY